MASSISPQIDVGRPFDSLAETAPRVGARLRARLHAGRLDGRLADGTDPHESPELALRAHRLTARSHRRRLAESLEQAVDTAAGCEVRVSAAAPLARREVRAARAGLLELAAALRSDGEVSPAGVALAQRLLTDGSGPLYVTSGHDALWLAARRATVALELRR